MNLMRHLRKKTEKSKQQGFQGAALRACVCAVVVLKRIQLMMQQKGGSLQTDILKQEKGRLGLQRKE